MSHYMTQPEKLVNRKVKGARD